MTKRLPMSTDRRGFLTVGAVAGLGLTLADFFRVQARAEQKHYDSIEAKAESVIHIFLPGGMAHQESFDPKPLRPDRVPRRDGHDPDEARRRRLQRVPDEDGRRSPTRSPSAAR